MRRVIVGQSGHNAAGRGDLGHREGLRLALFHFLPFFLLSRKHGGHLRGAWPQQLARKGPYLGGREERGRKEEGACMACVRKENENVKWSCLWEFK